MSHLLQQTFHGLMLTPHILSTLCKNQADSLCINDNSTKVETEHGRSILKICHPKEAFEQNRGYISTLLPALQCRMDVQSSDGHGLLLKYVSSYVAKGHDAYAWLPQASYFTIPSGFYCTKDDNLYIRLI